MGDQPRHNPNSGRPLPPLPHEVVPLQKQVSVARSRSSASEHNNNHRYNLDFDEDIHSSSYQVYKQTTTTASGPPEYRQHIPGWFYELSIFFGTCDLIIDFTLDLTFGTFNILTGNVVQGILGLVIILFPILQHATSSEYRKQDSLIPISELSHIYWESGLRCCHIFDPIIWQWNHYRHVRLYRREPAREQTRRNFYLAKQMAELSIKTEAQLENPFQACVALYAFIYYYHKYSLIAQLFLVVSVIFTTISITRAACSDLAKTLAFYYKQGYVAQSGIRDQGHTLFVASGAVATLIANTTFLYYVSMMIKQEFRYNLFVAIVLACILNLMVNTLVQFVWSLINDLEYYIMESNLFWRGCSPREENDPRPSLCRSLQSWWHFIVRSPLINLFRSASLYTYSLGHLRFIVLLLLNAGSLVLLFVPFWLRGPGFKFYAVFAYTFAVSISLSFVAAIVTKCLTVPLDLKIVNSKVYHLP